MADTERQPLLSAARGGRHASARGGGAGRGGSSSAGYGSHSGTTSFERTHLPLRIRSILLRRAAAVKERCRKRQKRMSGGAGVVGNSAAARGSAEEEAELADIIARTPDLEAIFQHRREGGSGGSSSSDVTSPLERENSGLGISTTLASSYGTIKRERSKDGSGSGGDSRTGGSAAAGGASPGSGTGSGMHRQRSLSVIAAGDTSPSPAAAAAADTNKKRRSSISASSALRQQPSPPPEEPFFSSEHAALLEEFTNPVGRYRRVWLLVIFLFVSFNAVIIPFSLAFQSLWHDMSYFITIAILSVCYTYLGDLFFCLDVVLYFFTPYTRDGMYERDLGDIRRHYLSTWFTLDLISSLPLDLALLPYGLEAVLLARLTRFFRFAKYDQYFQVWEQYSTRAPQAVRFFKLVLGLMLTLHWLACFWFWAGYRFGFGTTTWLPDREFKHADVVSQYIVSLWWSTNIITQVGGDPGLPTNNFERVADFFVSFIAVFVVAVVIGNVTELVSELSADAGEQRAKLAVLNNFMFARRLPEELQARIRNYYFTLWSRRGVNDEGTMSILQELPSNLRTEVSLVMNQDILGKVPIFQASSPGFINSLVLHLKPQTYTPKEFIVKQGDIGSEMYFISRGQVSVMAGERVVGRIGEGGFFGEIAVLQENAQRTASIQAVNFCDVFVLTHADLAQLFRTFPAERAIIMHVAETRRAKDLLRKTLTDPMLLARENTAGFGDPVLVNLLIDLFQPLDLSYMQAGGGQHKNSSGEGGANEGITLTTSGLRLDEHGEIVVGSPDEEEDQSEEAIARAGLLFSPADRAETIYFIGKGCVDIFAHPELEDTPEKKQRKRLARNEDLDGMEAERKEEEKALAKAKARRGKARRKKSDEDEEDEDTVDSGADTESHSGSNSDSDSDSDSSSDEDDDEDEDDPFRPQHVIRLTEGHFFGAISSEHYRISAVVPEEFRDEAIIFALTSHELGALHEYYNGLAVATKKERREGKKHAQGEGGDESDADGGDSSSDSDDDEHRVVCPRHSMKKSLVTWLQRHRTPLDYVKSMVSLHVHTQHIARLPVEEQRSLGWKALLKLIMSKSAKKMKNVAAAAKNAVHSPSKAQQQQQQAATNAAASSAASAASASSSAAFPGRQERRGSHELKVAGEEIELLTPADNTAGGGEQNASSSDAPSASAAKKPATEHTLSVPVLGRVTSKSHEAPSAAVTAADSTLAVAAGNTAADPANPADASVGATPSTATSAPRPRREHTIIVSPAESPDISVEPAQATAYSAHTWTMAPLNTETPAATPNPAATSTSSASATPLAAAFHSPPVVARTEKPDFLRSVSVGAMSPRLDLQRSQLLAGRRIDVSPHHHGIHPGVPASPFSPLMHRPLQTRGHTSQDVSELLAAADVAAHNQRTPSLGRRAISLASTDGGAEDEPVSAGGLRTVHHGPDSVSSVSSPALDWLTGASTATPGTTSSLPNLPEDATAGATAGQSGAEIHSPGRNLLHPGIRRAPSSTHVLPRSPAALQPRQMSTSVLPPLSGRHRGGSLVGGQPGAPGQQQAHQPFSFLLALPTAAAGGAGGPSHTPSTPSASASPYPSSSSSSSLALPPPSPGGTHGMGKRHSGPTTNVPLGVNLGGRRQSVAASAKKADFLERALSHLSSEELLLLSNKASMHLYARMQQAQQAQQTQAHQDTYGSPEPLAPPMRPFGSHSRSVSSAGLISPR